MIVPVAPGITLCRETVLALAAAHISHYSEQLDRCEANLADTQGYLATWRNVQTAVLRGRVLDSDERGELYDAVTSRDFDAFLTSDELLSVLGVGRARAS